MTRVQLFGIPQSNYVRAVRMACEEKSIDYELVPLMPQTEEARALHPFGKIPALRHGEVLLCESKAIASYLERLVPQPALFPADPVEFARMEQWVSLVNTVIDRTMVREYVLGYFFAQQQGRPVDRIAIDAVVPAMREQVKLLDGAVARTGFLAGRSFSFADVNVLPILAALQLYPEGAEAVQQALTLAAYFERHAQRASFRATDPWRS